MTFTSSCWLAFVKVRLRGILAFLFGGSVLATRHGDALRHADGRHGEALVRGQQRLALAWVHAHAVEQKALQQRELQDRSLAVVRRVARHLEVQGGGRKAAEDQFVAQVVDLLNLG